MPSTVVRDYRRYTDHQMKTFFFKTPVSTKRKCHQFVIINMMLVVLFAGLSAIHQNPLPQALAVHIYMNNRRKCRVCISCSCRYSIQHRCFGAKANAVIAGLFASLHIALHVVFSSTLFNFYLSFI